MSPIPSAPQPDPRSVFVVHGRNLKARDAFVNFLRSADLKPLTWEEAKAKAAKVHGDPIPFIGQILAAGLADACAVIVLFTGDDLARLKSVYAKEERMPQARPNVIFEAGLALGRYPERTILVQIGEVRGLSDIAGRSVIRLDGKAERLRELLRQLKDVGCAVSDHADLTPLGDELCESEPAHVEMPRRRLLTLGSVLLMLGSLGGVLGALLLERLSPSEVVFTVEVKAENQPVTAFLQVDHNRRVGSGTFDLKAGSRDPKYSVLLEVESIIVATVDVKAGQRLPVINVDEVFSRKQGPQGRRPLPKISVSDEEAGAIHQ